MIHIKEIDKLKNRITFLTLVVSLLAAVVISSRGAENQAVLKSISYQKLGKALEINIRLEGQFIYQAFALTNPNRLAINISPVDKIEADLYYEVNVMGVISLRTGQFVPKIVRVVFDFADQILPSEINKTEDGIQVRFSSAEPIAPKVIKEEQKIAAEVKEKPAEQIIEKKIRKEKFFNTMIGVSVGSYKIPDARFNEVYGNEAAPIYGLNLSRTLVSLQNFQLDVAFETKKFSKSGASTIMKEEAKFSMTPISIGGRVLYQTKYAMFFAEGGWDSYAYNEESSLASTNGSASGSHYELGVYLIPPELEFLRVKLYYRSSKVKALENKIEVELGTKNEYGVSLSFGFNVLNGLLINR